MLNLWTRGGLSLPELFRRTAQESWHDAVFGQGGRMAFYQFLAIFPSLLVLLALSERVPHLGGHVGDAIQDLSGQVLPDRVSQLFQKVMTELSGRALSGTQLIAACAGALWAALNATWAMIYGLNKAYEVEERRSWRELAVTISGLTLSLAIIGLVVFLVFCAAHYEAPAGPGAIGLHVLEWMVLIVALFVWFAVLYRFAPNLSDHEWRWSTPGALCALILWIGSTLAARVYFDHMNDYSRSYGHLNGAVMLLLWLYFTNGSILIGGEMNSEIEKAAGEQGESRSRSQRPEDRSGS
jgi:membrane protein